MHYRELEKDYDLIVVGGGLTGVAAAVAASRQGLSVLLLEQDGSLGGAMSNSFVFPFMRYTYWEDEKWKYLSAGIFKEMVERHRSIGGCSKYGWQPELIKMMLDDMIVEAGVDILFHTRVVNVVMDGRELKSVLAASKSGTLEIRAKFFIDASGDGELMALSGCAYQLGREEDNLCQPMTTCFRLSNVNMEKYYEEIPGLQKLYNEKQKTGEISNPRENMLIMGEVSRGVLHFNTTRIVKHNPVDPTELSRAEIEARKQVLEMFNFLRQNSEAFRESAIVSIAQNIGVRESRKLLGVHVLTADDLKSLTIFDDSIALGNYDIDIHNPEGTGTYIYSFPKETYYSIPYQSLLPRETDNLLVAGRCLSATHEAHSAVRIMPICTCMGEAAGVAAAQAVHTATNAHTLDIHAVQQTLETNGAKIR
ncbi:MAG: FAD-dependent oxidoreductase [Clostridia bacterium]|nr:FAD-dependent oxidoreductase [Clostridia bacterium]